MITGLARNKRKKSSFALQRLSYNRHGRTGVLTRFRPQRSMKVMLGMPTLSYKPAWPEQGFATGHNEI